MTKRLLAAFFAFLLLAAAASVQARQIKGMAGRTVTVPDKITKVFAPQLYTDVILYMVAPDTMVNVLQPACLPFRPEDDRLIRKEVLGKPYLLRQIRQGANGQMNMEAILALKPDIVIATGGENMKMDPTRIEQQYARLHLPLVLVDVDQISSYPAAIEFLGRLLGREARAKQLSAWARTNLYAVQRMVAQIPSAKRARVYYAESADGLATESDRSFHVDGLKMGGANIVHHGDLKTHYGMEKISLEQVLLYNPDVIFTPLPEFAAYAYKDSRWKHIRAVANHRVYIIPRTPFDWLDRPPSVTRLIGIPWVAYKLYPKQYPADIRKQIRDFHKLFMGVTVSNADLNRWLQ